MGVNLFVGIALSMLLLLIYCLICEIGHDWLENIIIVVAISTAIGGLICSFQCARMPYSSPELVATEHIVALSNDRDTQGKFYMRSGYIETVPYYYYMVSTGGGYAMNKVPAMYDTTTVYYTDGDFRVEWYKQEKRLLLDHDTITTYKIYIPNNSIDETFSISL